MSTEITTAFVKQFSANVFHLAQQKESRLKSRVRNESQQGKSAFYDRIGSVTAQKKVTRHGDTPQIDTPHSRRRVTLVDYEHADLIDEVDKLRLLMDPASQYSIAFSRALGRAIDDEIKDALGGDAFGGEEGSTTVSFPDSQTRMATTGSAAADLNMKALRDIKKVLDANEVEESGRHFAHSAEQMEALLAIDEAISADFNSVRALVKGDISTYLGLSFVRSERLDLLATARTDGEFSDGLRVKRGS